MRAERQSNQGCEQGLYTTSSYVKAVAACRLSVSGHKATRMQMSVDSQSIVIQPISQPLETHLASLIFYLFIYVLQGCSLLAGLDAYQNTKRSQEAPLSV